MDALDIKRGKTTAMLAAIPKHLKDPENFERIYKAIADAGRTKHSHGEVTDWAKCVQCQHKANDRLLMMRSLGFTSKAMYLTWLKVHSEMSTITRDRYPMYNKEKR